MARLFLALSAEALTEPLMPWMKKFKTGADRKDLSIRWVPAENRHITLIFFGETEPDRQAAIEARTAEIAATAPPLSLKIEGMGAFPESRAARVLWLGVQNSRKLRFLRDRIAESLRTESFAVEEDYSPHLTLGRLRNPKSVTDYLSPFERIRLGKLEANELVLYESIQAGPFPVYQPLIRFPLTGVPEIEAE